MQHLNPTTLGGALASALGLAMLVWLIPVWVDPDPDLRLPADLVPRLVAIGFLLCGSTLLLRGVLHQTPSPTAADAEPSFDPREARGLGIMIALLVTATLGFQVLHFMLVAPVLVAVTMWMFGPVRPVSLVLTACLGPGMIWVVVTHVLGRVLP